MVKENVEVIKVKEVIKKVKDEVNVEVIGNK
jgi:hypothetical protein